MAQTNLEHHADVRFGSDYSRKHVADIDLVGAFTTLILSFLNKLKKHFYSQLYLAVIPNKNYKFK